MALSLALTLVLAAAGGDAPGSFQDLVSGLNSPSAKTREESASALGRSKRREAMAPLTRALRDPERKVRLQAIRGLRELGDVEAAPALAIAIADAYVDVRQEAIAAALELYAGEQPGTMDRLLARFSDGDIPATIPPGVRVDAEVQTALIRALRDGDQRVRHAAAVALGTLGSRQAVGELSRATLDPAADVRKAVAIAIAQVGTSADGKLVLPLLADEESEVRSRAVLAVGHLKVKEAGPLLRQMYEENARKEAGLKALTALSRIGDAGQRDLFQQLAQDPDVAKKRLAVEGLGRISDASRLSAFKKDYQRERNDEVRLAYAFALVRLGDRDFIDTLVLSLASRTLGERSRDYLLELGRDVLPDLYPYLGDFDAGVRAAVCDLIAAAGDPSAIARLTPLLSDPNPTVADRAHLAVERLRRLVPAASR